MVPWFTESKLIWPRFNYSEMFTELSKRRVIQKFIQKFADWKNRLIWMDCRRYTGFGSYIFLFHLINSRFVDFSFPKNPSTNRVMQVQSFFIFDLNHIFQPDIWDCLVSIYVYLMAFFISFHLNASKIYKHPWVTRKIVTKSEFQTFVRKKFRYLETFLTDLKFKASLRISES